MKKKNTVLSVLLIIFFVIVALITILPLLLLFVSSFRPGSDLMRYGLNFDVNWATANLDNYQLLFSGQNNYFTWYKNLSLIHISPPR